MTANEKYWVDRAERRMKNYQLSAFDAANVIKRSYNGLINYVDAEIAKILKHVGGEDTAAYEYRMKRLTALLANVDKKIQEQYGLNLLETTAFLKDIIPEAYYHTIFDIAQGAGEQPKFSRCNPKLIDKIINENWSGQNYSKRIWSNTEKLAEDLREVLTEAAMTGESIYKTSRKVAEAFDTSAYNAQRLIRTETTYATNQAELLAEQELDIDKYKFVATLDLRTSPICQKQDGKLYKTKEATPGVNFPPMHPNCRSTHIPYFPDGMPELRVAKDKDGKRITVPADMTYDEWYKKYIEPYEGKKAPKTAQRASEGKDTIPMPTTAKKSKNEAATIEIPAPAENKSEYTDIPIPKKPSEKYSKDIVVTTNDELDEVLNDKNITFRGLPREDAMSDWGHAMFTDDGAAAYFPDEIHALEKSNRHAFYAEKDLLTNVEDIEDKIYETWEKDRKSGVLDDYGFDEKQQKLSKEELFDLFNPQDIVDDALGFDSEDFTAWFKERIAEENGIVGIKTNDGAIVFDKSIIHEIVPKPKAEKIIEKPKEIKVNTGAMTEYENFKAELSGKYKNIYLDATDAEIDKLEELERKAYKGG